MPVNPTPAEGVGVPLPCPFCGNTNAAPFLDDTQGMKWGSAMCPECSARGPEVRTAYDTTKQASWRTEAIEEWNARPAAPTQSAAQTGEVDAEAVHWIRQASLEITGGNCAFVDDDLRVLAHLAKRAVDAGLTDGLSPDLQRSVAALSQPEPSQ